MVIDLKSLQTKNVLKKKKTSPAMADLQQGVTLARASCQMRVNVVCGR